MSIDVNVDLLHLLVLKEYKTITRNTYSELFAAVAESADAPALGAGGLYHVGSSPTSCTSVIKEIIVYFQNCRNMENQKIVWLRNGRILSQVSDTIEVLDNLPKRIYTMNFDQVKHEIFLEDFADRFHFGFKIYGMESKLINHIIGTFKSTNTNLGILFNGTKGTGKTISAKIIANETNLPVILINSPYPGLSDFISKIQCPCVLFFDEFEKNFNTDKGYDTELLSIMDGVFNGPYRRVFLLTTNKLYINENFIGRPSRIRYKKTFGNLDPEVVLEYLNDNLIYKNRAAEIVDFIDGLAISTIDILKSIVEEVNIHNCSVTEFKDFINVEFAPYRYKTLVGFYDLNVENALKDFKADVSKIGTVKKNSDGTEYTVTARSLDIDERTINSITPIENMIVGNKVDGWGTIIQKLDNEGFMVVEDEDSRICFKFLNVVAKPSLYRGSLIF